MYFLDIKKPPVQGWGSYPSKTSAMQTYERFLDLVLGEGLFSEKQFVVAIILFLFPKNITPDLNPFV